MIDNAASVAAAARAYVAAGLALVPIAEGSKGPKTGGWQRKLNAIYTMADLERVKPHGIGLAHRWSGTCAIDIDDIDKSRGIFAEYGIDLDAMLANPTYAISKSPRGRFKLWFWLPIGEILTSVEWTEPRIIDGKTENVTLLEFRCAAAGDDATVQDVLPPTIYAPPKKHPEMVGRYEWVQGDLTTMYSAPHALLEMWRAKLKEREHKSNGDAARPINGANHEFVIDPDKISTPDKLGPAIAFMANDLSRKEWVEKFGFALKTASVFWPEQGLAMWIEFSMRYPGNTEDGVRKTWEGLKPRGDIGAGTIFQMAMDRGWEPPLPNIFRGVNARTVPRVEWAAAPDTGKWLIWADTIGKDALKVDWIVKGLIERQSLFLVYGPPKSGKSFLITDLVLHIVSNREWFGLKIKQPGLVLYIAREGIRGMQRRIIAHMQHHRGLMSATPGSDIRVNDFALVTYPVNLMESPSVDAFMALVDEAEKHAGKPVAMVIIDTLALSMPGGDENSAKDMSIAVASAVRLRDERGASVGIVHHEGKTEGRGPRGSGAITGAIDLQIAITKDAESGISTAHVDAERDGAGDFKVAFKLDRVVLGNDEDGDEITSSVVVQAELADVPQKGKKLNASAARALQILRNVMASSGSKSQASENIPQGVPIVSEFAWREAYYKATPDAGQDTKKKAFGRAMSTLLDSGHVGTYDRFVWIVNA